MTSTFALKILADCDLEVTWFPFSQMQFMPIIQANLFTISLNCQVSALMLESEQHCFSHPKEVSSGEPRCSLDGCR